MSRTAPTRHLQGFSVDPDRLLLRAARLGRLGVLHDFVPSVGDCLFTLDLVGYSRAAGRYASAMMPKHAVSAVVYLNPIDNLSENVFIDVPCSFAVSRTCSSSRQAFDEVREDFRSVTDVVDSRNALA